MTEIFPGNFPKNGFFMGFSKIKILGIFSENPERPPNSEKKILGNFRGGIRV